ncbi:MAG: immunoglobulin domain-containing protein [Verrucomicrobia bacterium]|nr:immunoglobulin domain-containing protein [Verrucomicrobiota bacterium]
MRKIQTTLRRVGAGVLWQRNPVSGVRAPKTGHGLGACFVLLGLAITAAAQPADIRQGLVAYWPFESTDGATTLDATPFANHLNVVNLSAGNFTAGRFANAVTLNGSSTYLTNLHTPEDFPIKGLPIYRAGTYTIAMWVKGAAQTAKYLFSEGNTNTAGSTAGQTPIFILQTGQAAGNNSKFDVIMRNDGNTTLLNHMVSASVVFDNTWHHIAWVDDRGRARLYVDGNLDTANFNYTPAGTFTLNTTAIGTLVRGGVSTGAIFNGQIDDLALWERALTQTEVQQVMNNSLVAPVPELPPYLDRTPPANLTRMVGDRITLVARAVGNRPLNYQWSRGGQPIEGAIGPSLTLSNLAAADSGNYTISAQNIDGEATATTVLTVLPDPTPDLRQSLVSHWPFETMDDNGQGGILTPDLYSHNDMDMVNMDINNEVPGLVSGISYTFDGVNEHLYRRAGFPVFNNPGYSVSFWVNANGVGQSNRTVFAESSTNSPTPVFALGTHVTGTNTSLRVFVRGDANAVVLDRTSTRSVLDGVWHHVVWSETNGLGRLYIDGALDETDFSFTRTNLTLDQTALGALRRATVDSYFAGTLDEVAIWSRVLTLTEIQQLQSTGVPAPIGDIPPTITQSPASQSVLTSSKVTFTFTATGTSPLLSQWRKGGADLEGQTNATLFLNRVTLGDAGDYDVVVANSAGRATSQVATLTVAVRPPSPTELKIDFNNLGSESPADTEPGFTSFALPAFGPGPFRKVFGGAEVVVSGVNVRLESRLRTTPSNAVDFTEEKLLRDFIFSYDVTNSDGMDISVEFLEPNVPYTVTFWSFDSSSLGNNRVSDWSANGTLVEGGYTFIGSDPPVNNGRYRISFDATADADGTILIQGRRNSTAAGGINVFLNALQVTRHEMRVLGIEVPTPGALKLTFQVLNPAAPHRVVEKASLADPEWREVPDVTFLPPSGNIMSAVFSMPAASTRFYRIVEGP